MDSQAEDCYTDPDSYCPFVLTEMSCLAQDTGSVMSGREALVMALCHGKLLACNKDPENPCRGLIGALKRLDRYEGLADAPVVAEEVVRPQWTCGEPDVDLDTVSIYSWDDEQL